MELSVESGAEERSPIRLHLYRILRPCVSEQPTTSIFRVYAGFWLSCTIGSQASGDDGSSDRLSRSSGVILWRVHNHGVASLLNQNYDGFVVVNLELDVSTSLSGNNGAVVWNEKSITVFSTQCRKQVDQECLSTPEEDAPRKEAASIMSASTDNLGWVGR